MAENIQPILEKLGLTKQETKAYVALFELGEAQTGSICTKSNIASSNIYRILDSLINKGMVSYRIQNNVKVFMPSPPEVVNEIFKQKQIALEEERKELTSLLAVLKKTNNEEKSPSNYKYFEGVFGVQAMFHEINQMMNPQTPISIYTAKKESYKKLVEFHDEHHTLRLEKKVKERMIFPLDDPTLATKRRNTITEIKFLDLQNDSEWGVMENYFFIQHITGKIPRSFLIKDEIFAKTMQQVFEQLWSISKT